MQPRVRLLSSRRNAQQQQQDEGVLLLFEFHQRQHAVPPVRGPTSMGVRNLLTRVMTHGRASLRHTVLNHCRKPPQRWVSPCHDHVHPIDFDTQIPVLFLRRRPGDRPTGWRQPSWTWTTRMRRGVGWPGAAHRRSPGARISFQPVRLGGGWGERNNAVRGRARPALTIPLRLMRRPLCGGGAGSCSALQVAERRGRGGCPQGHAARGLVLATTVSPVHCVRRLPPAGRRPWQLPSGRAS